MPVRFLIGPLFQAERVEATVSLAYAEAQSEEPPYMLETFVKPRSRAIKASELFSPHVKLVRLIEEFIIGQQE